MTRMLDCLVNYFGLDEDGRPTYRRYFCYHIIAGPGPTPESGVAAITVLAIHQDAQRCDSCPNFHVVDTGGPTAALTKAIHYLDVYHRQDRLRKVQSEIRGLGGALPAATAPLARPAPIDGPRFQEDSTPTR